MNIFFYLCCILIQMKKIGAKWETKRKKAKKIITRFIIIAKTKLKTIRIHIWYYYPFSHFLSSIEQIHMCLCLHCECMYCIILFMRCCTSRECDQKRQVFDMRAVLLLQSTYIQRVIHGNIVEHMPNPCHIHISLNFY